MTECEYCCRKLVAIKNDFTNRKYHKKCFFEMKKYGLIERKWRVRHFGDGRVVRKFLGWQRVESSDEEE